MKSKRILFICDHILDQRLRKRVNWLSSDGWVVVVCQKVRAHWLDSSDANYETIPYETIKDQDIAGFDIIYLSGAKIFIDKFFLLFRARNKKTIISEIPDLPLRKKSLYANLIMAHAFSLVVRVISTAIVFTSQSYKKYLPTDKPSLLLENLPSDEVSKKLECLETKDKSGRVSIIFAGVIRYIPQLKLLLKYANDNSNVSVEFYGGPDNLITSLIDELNCGDNVLYKGEFNYEKDIVDIYRRADLIYSVYDAQQLNVRVALPNKLYEASLSKRPIMVAENTYLSSIVRSNELGVVLPFHERDYEKFRALVSDFISKKDIWLKSSKRKHYRDSIISATKEQKFEFITFINKNLSMG